VAATLLTCADVEARDLDAGYLAGRLSPEEAAAYEAHYFGCDRCWATLRLASEARAALAVGAPAVVHRRWRRRHIWGLASAATLLLVAGTVQFLSSRRPIGSEAAVLRGPADSISVHSAAAEGTLSASWASVPDADRYRVRLFDAQGEVLLERETADTALTISLDSLTALPRSGARYWQVLALDRLLRPLSRSPLTPASPPP
jgi:Putative zinc-finger